MVAVAISTVKPVTVKYTVSFTVSVNNRPVVKPAVVDRLAAYHVLSGCPPVPSHTVTVFGPLRTVRVAV